jgi:hypothetical protein
MFANQDRLMLYCVCLFNAIVVGVGVWASDILDPPVFDTPTATAEWSTRLDAIADDNGHDEPTASRSNRGHRIRAVIRPLQAMETAFSGGQWAVLAGASTDIPPTRAIRPSATSLESLHVRLQV